MTITMEDVQQWTDREIYLWGSMSSYARGMEWTPNLLKSSPDKAIIDKWLSLGWIERLDIAWSHPTLGYMIRIPLDHKVALYIKFRWEFIEKCWQSGLFSPWGLK